MTIEEAKQRLPLSKLFHQLGICSKIPEKDGQCVQCPWPDRHNNRDSHPSFNIYRGGTQFHCYGCGVSGDGPDLVAAELGLSKKEAIVKFIRMAGGEPENYRSDDKPKKMEMPSNFSAGTMDQWSSLAQLRRISVEAVALAAGMRVIGFGSVCQCDSWIVTDEQRIVAEGRRMDGRPYPKIGSLPERKAHTIARSKKNWPVGLAPKHSNIEAYRKILVCEGGPDLLAAYHFCEQFRVFDALPVAMLGRAVSGIHPEALKRFKDKRVRLFPHVDPDGGGVESAKRWKEQIESAGARKVDAFDFSGLVRKDGKPVGDLNDCTVIRPEDESELEGVLP